MGDAQSSRTDPEALFLARSLSTSFAVHVGVRAIEALSVGWLAGALVAASASVTMHSSVPVQAWFAAGLCAGCAAASAWMQHPPRRDEHVRDADRRLSLDGALVTSAGVVPSALTGTMAAALVRRVAERLHAGELLRAALPRTPLALLAALAGAAVLFAAQDANQRAIPSSSPGDPTMASLLESAALESTALESAAQAVRSAALGQHDSREDASRPAALTALANDLERAARAPDVTAAEADRLQRAIEAAQRTESAPSMVRALESAHSAVESVRSASARTSAGGAVGSKAQGSASSAVKGAQPTPDNSGGTAASPGGSPGALASAAADGRMSARNADPQRNAAPRATGSTASAPERGVGTTRWWPPAYDAIVESWLSADAPGH